MPSAVPTGLGSSFLRLPSTEVLGYCLSCLRHWRRAVWPLLPLLLLALPGCLGSKAADARGDARFRFTDVTAAAGIDFVQQIGKRRPVDILRTTGSGLAWIDYDRDGWPDLFCVNESPPDPEDPAHLGHR